MKLKITFLSICFFLFAATSFAQKNNEPKSIITRNATIKKYHTLNDLEEMHKGKLLELYIERIKALTSIIPYIAFATKPGITMSALGIPNTNDNRKALDNQHDNMESYIDGTVEFQEVMLPYSDTRKIINAVLFYEDIMKSLHSYDEYN